MAANSTIPVLLCEDDIPGTSLAGQQPASLKNAELCYTKPRFQVLLPRQLQAGATYE